MDSKEREQLQQAKDKQLQEISEDIQQFKKRDMELANEIKGIEYAKRIVDTKLEELTRERLEHLKDVEKLKEYYTELLNEDISHYDILPF